MNLEDYRTVFAASSLVLMLIVAAPTLGLIVSFPSGGERFSEFWVLGPNHLAEDYPFNVRVNESYSVFVGVGNHMGVSSYYLVYVKFRNQTQSSPNSFNRTSSSLPSLFNITAFVADEGVWELPVTFSFDYVYNQNLSRIDFYSLTLNDVALGLRSSMISINSTINVFLGNLFFELWIYDATTGSFRYHERSVGLWFNMTV